MLNDGYTNDIPKNICPLYKLPSIPILFQYWIVYLRCFPIIIHVGISQFFPVNNTDMRFSSFLSITMHLNNDHTSISGYSQTSHFKHAKFNARKIYCSRSFVIASAQVEIPWVPEDIFFFLSIPMVRGEAASTRRGLFHLGYFENGPLKPG